LRGTGGRDALFATGITCTVGDDLPIIAMPGLRRDG